jgi:thiol-disulfide isomerase/thioredoxin
MGVTLRRVFAAIALTPLLTAGGGEPLQLVDAGGDTVALALAPEDSALVAHFWASWCHDCVREIPTLERVARDCEGRGIRFVTVNVGEGAEEIERFRGEHPFSLPVLRDPDGRAWRGLARGLPANLVWTPEGRRVSVGPREEAEWARELRCPGGEAR